MISPIKSHTNNRNQISKGKEIIKAKLLTIPRIGTTGTKGVLNVRGASGYFFLRISTPKQTNTKASKVPILVISPTTLIGTNPANKQIKIQSKIFDLHGV